MRSLPAAECVVRLSELGFREPDLMVHPGHLWPAELSADQRRSLRRQLEQLGLRLVILKLVRLVFAAGWRGQKNKGNRKL